MQRKSSCPKHCEHFIFPFAGGTAKLCGRDHEVRESPLRRNQPEGSEDLREELQGNSERSQPTEAHDDAEARNDSGSIDGDLIHRHHTEPRVHLYVPREETFPIPLKLHWRDQDNTHTNLDVLQEKRQRLLDRRVGSRLIGTLYQFHAVYNVEWKTSSRIFVVWEAPDTDSSNYQTWLFVAWDLDWHVESSQESRRSKTGLWKKPKLDKRSKTERHLLYWSGRRRA